MEFPFQSKFWPMVIDTPENRQSFDYQPGFQVIGRLRDDVRCARGRRNCRRLAVASGLGSGRSGRNPSSSRYSIEWAVKPRHSNWAGR